MNHTKPFEIVGTFGGIRFPYTTPSKMGACRLLAPATRCFRDNEKPSFIAILANGNIGHSTSPSIELAQGQTSLGALTFTEQSRLTRAMLWPIGLLMIGATTATAAAGYTSVAPHLMQGLDGMTLLILTWGLKQSYIRREIGLRP